MVSSIQVFRLETLAFPLPIHACYMSHTSSSISVPNNIWWCFQLCDFHIVRLLPQAWSNYSIWYLIVEQPLTQKFCFLNDTAFILFWRCYVLIWCERFWYYTLPCNRHVQYICLLPKNYTSKIYMILRHVSTIESSNPQGINFTKEV